MTNSDSGNLPMTGRAHQSGDRVRIRHNPRHDHSYSAGQNRARQALAGQIGSVRERTVAGAYRVATAGTVGRGAWFEADELDPASAADGLPVGGTDAPSVDRPVPELRAGVLASFDALEAKLGIALQEAQGWHEAAQDARQEARETKDAAAGLAASADALQGKLGAAEGQLDAVRAAWGKMRALLGLHRPLGAVWLDALDAVDKALGGVEVDSEALPCKLTVNFSEWHGTAHAVPTSDREPRRWRLTFPMVSPVAAAEKRNLIAPGRTRHAATIGGWIGQAMVVQRAPVAGAAVELEVVEWIEPKEAKPWTLTGDLDQRVAEIEARLGRLESGEAAARAEGDRIFGGSK